jgi:hypothetical protein
MNGFHSISGWDGYRHRDLTNAGGDSDGFGASLNHSDALDLREDYRQRVFEIVQEFD